MAMAEGPAGATQPSAGVGTMEVEFHRCRCMIEAHQVEVIEGAEGAGVVAGEEAASAKPSMGIT